MSIEDEALSIFGGGMPPQEPNAEAAAASSADDTGSVDIHAEQKSSAPVDENGFALTKRQAQAASVNPETDSDTSGDPKRKSVTINRRKASTRIVDKKDSDDAAIQQAIKDSLGAAVSKLDTDEHRRLVTSISDLIVPLQESAFGVGYLVESIARTIEHASPMGEADNVKSIREQRMQAAEKLHSLAKDGGRDALKEAVRSLKILIHDIKAVRERVKLLEDTNASAHSALNQSEHRLDDLRQLHEQLMNSLINCAGEKIDPSVQQKLQDFATPDADRVFAAENVFYQLAQTPVAEGDAPVAEASVEVSARVQELESEIQRLEVEVQRLESALSSAQSDVPADDRVSLLEAKLALVQSEVDEKNEAIAEAHKHIEEHAGQSGIQSQSALIEAERDQLQQELDTVRTELDQRDKTQAAGAAGSEAEIEELRAELSAAHAELADLEAATQAGGDESNAEEMQHLQDELDQARQGFDKERQHLVSEKSTIQQDLDELRREFTLAQDQLNQEKHELEKNVSAAQLELQAAQERYAVLEERLHTEELEADNAGRAETEKDALLNSLRAQLAEQLIEKNAEIETLQADVNEAATRLDEIARLESYNVDLEQLLEELRKQAAALNEELDNANAEIQSLRDEQVVLQEQVRMQIQDEGNSVEQLHAAIEVQNQLKEQVQDAERRVAEKQDLLDELEQGVGDSEQALIQLRQELAEAQAEQESLRSVADQHETLVDEHAALKAELENQLSTSTSTGEELAALKANHDEILAKRDQAFVDLENEHAELKQAYVALEDQTQAQLQERDEALDALREQVSSSGDSLSEKEVALQDAQAELAEKQTSLDKAIANGESYEEDAQRHQAELETAQSELQKLNENLQQQQQDIESKEESLAAAQSELAAFNETLEAQKTELESSREALLVAQSELETLRMQVSGTDESLAEKERALQELQEDASGKQSIIEDTQSRITSLEDSLAEQRASLEEKEEELDSAHDEVAVLKQQLETAQGEQESAQSQQVGLDRERAQLQEDIDALRAELNDLRISTSESATASQEALESAQSASESLREQLRNNQEENDRLVQSEESQQEVQAQLHIQITTLQEQLAEKDQALEHAASAHAEELDAQKDSFAQKLNSLSEEKEQIAETAQTAAALEEEMDRLREQSAADQQKAIDIEKALNQQLEQIEEEKSQLSRGYEERIGELEQSSQQNETLHKQEKQRAEQVTTALETASTAGARLASSLMDLCESIPQHVGDRELGGAEDALVRAQGDLSAAAIGLQETADDIADAREIDAAVIEERYAALQNGLNLMSGAMTELIGTLAEDHERLSELQQRIHGLEEREQGLQQRLDEEQGRSGDAEGSVEVLRTELNELETEREGLEQQLAAETQQVATLNERLHGAEENASSLTGQLRSLEQELETERSNLQAQVAELSQQQEKLSDQQQRDHSKLNVLISAWQQSVQAISKLMPRDNKGKERLADALTACSELKELVHEASAQGELRESLAGEIAAAQQRVLRNYSESLSALSGNSEELASRAEALQTAEQHVRQELDELTATHSELSKEKQRLESSAANLQAQYDAVQAESETHHKELHELRQEHSGVVSDLASAQSLIEEQRESLALKAGLETGLKETQEELARCTHRMEDAESAGQELIRAIKDLGMHSSDLFDQLGLMSPGASRRFDRTTQSLTKATSSGVPMQVAEFGSELLKRIMDQISEMHRDLRETRTAQSGSDERITVLDNEIKQEVAVSDELRKEHERLEKALSASQASESELRTAKQDVDEQLLEHQQLFEQHQQQKADLIENLNADLDEAEASAVALKEQFDLEAAQILKQFEQAQEQNRQLGSDLERLQDELVGVKAEAAGTADSLRDTIDEREAKLSKQVHEIDQLKEERLEVKGLEARIRTLKDKLADADRDAVRLHKEVEVAAHAREEAAVLQLSVRDLQGERDKHARNTRKLERQLAEEKARSQSLKKARDKQQSDSVRKIERLNNDAQSERDRRESIQEELRLLKRELAGLRARSRTADSSLRKKR